MHFCVGDRCEAETGLGGIVQMRADVGEVDERHCDGSIGLRGLRDCGGVGLSGLPPNSD